jgi:NADPH:quinone reductase
MRAVRFEQTGGVEVLEVVDVPDPTPGPGQIVVAIAFSGLNFIDIYQRTGIYKLPLPSGLGLEGAGTVVAVGEGVADRHVGQRVCWPHGLGSYAEQVVIAADRTVTVPDDVDLETACSLMLQGMTAHYLSHSTFPLGPEHTALVYAANGGVGRLLVQLAKQRGARVLACTSTPEKATAVRALGADEVILYRDVDIAATVRELTGGVGVDVAYDSVGATTWEATLNSIRPRGYAVFYGAASGPIPPISVPDLGQRGSLFLTRPGLAHHIATREELESRGAAMLGLAREGRLDVLVHGHYPLEDIGRAQTDLTSGTTSGKLLLRL